MGRIAEAMRKAQAERADKQRLETGPVRATDGLGPPAQECITDGSEVPGTEVVSRLVRPDDAAAAGAREALRMSAVDPAIVAVTDPTSAVAEQYRAIRTWLLRRNTTGEHRSVAITSSVPREGKSVTSVNLAVCLAEVRHLSVLLLDADLRRGSISALTGVPTRPGLADVLDGESAMHDAIHPTGLKNLCIMPAGQSRRRNPAELLSSRIAQSLFDEVRERFHYVLVDTPPVQTASDVAMIGGMCTGVLMVVRMHRTAQHVVRQSVRWLQSNNLQVFGCVLAAANVRRTSLSYSYPYNSPSTSGDAHRG